MNEQFFKLSGKAGLAGPLNSSSRLIGLVLFLWATLALSLPPNGRTMVFDMDGVVLFQVPPDSNGEHLISIKSNPTAGGDLAASAEVYRVADGFGEFVDLLVERGWRISVFSFGNEERNRNAAAAIQLPSGGTLLSAIEKTGGDVFSNTDGYNLDPNDPRKVFDSRMPKSLRPKIVKDQSRVMPPDQAQQAFLVEDILNNSAPGLTVNDKRLSGQRETNTIHLPYHYVLDGKGREVPFLEHLDGIEPAVKPGGSPEIDRALKLFAELHGKMAYLAGLVLEIETQMETNPKSSFSEILQKIQWQQNERGEFITDRNGDRVIKPDLQTTAAFVSPGAATLKRVPNSSYNFVQPFNPASYCRRLTQAFNRSNQSIWNRSIESD